MRTTGQRIKQIRQELGLTQAEFADRLNVKRATLANWEIDRTEPDLAMLGTIAQYGNTTIDYVSGRSDNRYCDSNVQPIKEVDIEVVIDENGKAKVIAPNLSDEQKSVIATIAEAFAARAKRESE